MSEALLVKAEKVIEKQSKAILPMLREKFVQLKPSEAVDLLINGGLAYLGVHAFRPQGTAHFVGSALFGPVAMKLAQAENIPAGLSGVVGLTILGVAQSGEAQEVIAALLDPNMGYVEGDLVPLDELLPPIIVDGVWTCPEGYHLVAGPSAAVCKRDDI